MIKNYNNKLEILRRTTNHKNDSVLKSDSFKNKISDKKNIQTSSIGVSADFIYDFKSGYFTSLQDSIFNITGIKADEIVFNDAALFYLKIIIDEHIESVCLLTDTSMVYCRKIKKTKSLSINIEYNIRTIDNEQKRILCQFTPIFSDAEGLPMVTTGKLIDITHTKKDGLPLLYIVSDNILEYLEYATCESLIKSRNIPFSQKEIHIIKLFSDGFRVNEVARITKLSISTIYTHRKNINKKSGVDLAKTINSLKEKGII